MVQPVERVVEGGEVRAHLREKGRDLRAFEPDGRTFGIVLVVGVRRVRPVHDRVELTRERGESIDGPVAFGRQSLLERHPQGIPACVRKCRASGQRRSVASPFMATQTEKAERFAALHHGQTPLLLPNPWDAGSARVFVALGFDALATTSSGFAGTLGRLDGATTKDEALSHAAAIVAATDVPVSADLENGFADDPGAVGVTITLARSSGLAGGSVEDYAGREADEVYDIGLAAERVAAAAEAAHRDGARFVLTARSENFIRQRPDLADTIKRLQAYQAAGADAVYAPGVSTPADIRTIVESVDVPVNVLALPGVPSVAELGALGVARVSIGGAFSYVALGAAADAAREFLEQGTYGFWNDAGAGAKVARQAFTA